MKHSSGHGTGPRIGRALATAAVALLCVAALGQPHPAYARGGGEGFHGGGGGFHSGGGGFHSGGGGFHGGGGGFHGGGGLHGGGGFHGGSGFRGGGGGFQGGGFRRFGGFRRDGFSGGGFYAVDPSDGSSEYGQPSPAAVWYYCADPAGYYPYVTQCNTDWQSVPAS